MDKPNKQSNDAKKQAIKNAAGGTAAGVAESAVDQAIDNVVPTRAAVHQAASDAVRGVPVVGDIFDLGQKAGYAMHLGKLFKRRKKEK